MKIRGWAVAGLAAVLLSSCVGDPEALVTTSSADQEGAEAGPTTILSSGSIVCEFPSEQDDARLRAEKMVAAEEQFAAAMTDRVGFAVHDHRFDVSCYRNGDTEFETASIVKVATVAALLRQIEQDPFRQSTPDEQEFAPEEPELPAEMPGFVPAPPDLTPAEHDLAFAAITYSDNDAQEELWQLIGGSQAMSSFLAEAGVTGTVFDADEQWGLTLTTAADQLRLMDALATGDLLTAEHSAYLLELMRNIDPEQIWGVSSGVPEGASIALKNGWLDDPTGYGLPVTDEDEQTPGNRWGDLDGDDSDEEDPYEVDAEEFGPDDYFDPYATWTSNSIGFITSAEESYSLVVLSDGNATDAAGREQVDRLCRLIGGTLLG